MALQLFDYQRKMLGALRNGFNEGHKVQMLYAGCGAGKTECAIAMMEAMAARGKKATMLTDLTDLCKQTSARLAKYGLDHGVIQPQSPRYRPDLNIQVAMIQTIETRQSWPKTDLLIIDEAHSLRASVIDFIRSRPEMEVVGLSGSPFTKGLGAVYTNVVSRITVNELVEMGRLIAPRVFIAKEIDMTGAKKTAGEWQADEVATRGAKIAGDIVAEWQDKSDSLFGGPIKTIVFCAGINHGDDLSKRFADAGHNFIALSHKSDPDFRADVLAEFAKPDSSITGLIATDLLTKGFDVTDISIMISARPFSKSFSSHVQQMGRIMRVHHSKETAVILDHAGNYLRFRDQWDDLCTNGVSALDDGAEKTKKEPTEKEKEASKCPQCHALWIGGDMCPHCGYVRAGRNNVAEVAGEMQELEGGAKKEKYSAEYKAEFYAGLMGYVQAKGWKPGTAYHLYVEKFKVGPSMKKPVATHPNQDVLGWIQHRNMKRAFAAKRAA